MKQLGGLDTLFLRAEMHGMPMHVSILSIYDPSTSANGSVEFRDILDLFENCTQDDIPLLRCKLMEVPFNLDQPYWVEDQNFDLVYHVRHIALPKPGNWQKLCSLVANLHAQPLNRNRPLWEVHVIDGIDHVHGMPSGCFAILLKVHHALMDGKTAMTVFNSLHEQPELDAKVNNESMPDFNERFFAHESDIRMPQIMAKAVINNVYRSGNLLRMAGHLSGLYSNIRRGLESREWKELEKIRTRFNGCVSPRRVVDRINIPLDDIRYIRDQNPDITVNDIVLAIIGGAMRRYLLAKDEMPEDTLVAAVPLTVKRDDGDTSVGNHRISIANVALRTDVKNDFERLQRVHKESQAGDAYAKALGNNLIADTMNNLYSGLVAWGMKAVVDSGVLEKFPPANNTIVANVSGSEGRLFLCGARMLDSFCMGPLIPNTGLFHAVSSTWQCVTIAFTADRQKMEDPGFYASCLQESFDELCRAVVRPHEQLNAAVDTTEVTKTVTRKETGKPAGKARKR